MNKLYLLTLGLVLTAIYAAASYVLEADLRAVQTGEVKLVCLMKDGQRTIAPDMVTGFIDDAWVFKNGYASARSCQIKR